MLNLAVNARDAMLEGGTLRISAVRAHVGRGERAALAEGDYVRLSIADTGAGMDEPTRVRAVEPFFSTKGVGKGTGLGLSMVHGLALQLGGSLTIDSTPGVGTNVELWLPVTSTMVGRPTQASEAAGDHDHAGHVLLVDDEELVRSTTAAMLGDLGYRVTEAASADVALTLVRDGVRPDLLVTDHLMPGMTGTELARRLQSEFTKLRVLIVSGYAEHAGIAPDLPRLTKPFRAAELAASVATARAATRNGSE